MPNNQGFSKFPTEKTFHIDHTSDLDGERYSGTFTVKRPTMLDQVAIEAEKSRILGGKYYDPATPGVGVSPLANQMAEGLSFLRICLSSSPDWWNDGDIYDPGVMIEIYEEAMKIDPFRFSENSERDASGRGAGKDSHPKPDHTNHDDVLAEMVDEEI